MIRTLTAALTVSVLAMPAAAQEFALYGGAALQYNAYEDDPKSDLNGYLEAE